MFVILALLLSILVPATDDSLSLPGDGSEAPDFTIRIETGAAISELMNLGDIAAGTEKNVRVRVYNATAAPFEFLKAKVSCNCTKVEIPQVVVEPEEYKDLKLAFSIDEHPGALSKEFSATIFLKGKPNLLHLRFRAKLNGVVSVVQRSAMVAVAENESREKRIRIPLILSSDIHPSDVRVETRGSVSLSDVKVLVDSKGPFINGLADVSKLKDDQKEATFLLSRNGEDAPLEIVYFFKRTKPIEIVPQFLMFRPSRDDSKKKFKCTVLVRVNPPVESIKKMTVVLGGKQLAVKSSTLPRGLQRLEVVANAKDLEQAKKIDWAFVTSSGEYLLETGFRTSD